MQVNQWYVTFIFSLNRCLIWINESCTADLTNLRVTVMIKHLGLCPKPSCFKGVGSDLPEWMQIFILREHFGWRKCDLHKIWSVALCVCNRETSQKLFGADIILYEQIGKHLKSLWHTRPLQQLCWWLKSLLNEQILSIICQLGSQRKTVLVYTGAFKATVSPYTMWPWRAKECFNNSLMERASKCAKRHTAHGSTQQWCGERAPDSGSNAQICWTFVF